MVKKDNSGKRVTRTIFLGLSFMFGVLIWALWQGNILNYSQECAKLDTQINALLFECGVKDIDISSQSRQEMKKGIELWIEYYKEIILDPEVSIQELKEKIKKTANENKYYFVSSKLGENTEIVKVGLKEKVFSRNFPKEKKYKNWKDK